MIESSENQQIPSLDNKEASTVVKAVLDTNTNTPISKDSLSYPGDFVDNEIPSSGHTLSSIQPFNFKDPFLLVCFFDQAIADGHVTLWPWQMQELEHLGSQNATSKLPHKYCLIANNGSGKDKFIIAPFAIWFTLTKLRSRVIITTASGSQLTSQTEPYISDLARKVNTFFGREIYRIRQRYIKCMETGSEIRMFATDEAGKAEGYHPIDPNSEMAIIVNEAKSVNEDIHKALRRCTGYNYWLEISSTGEPKGFFYTAATDERLHFHTRKITSFECPHITDEERASDILLDGEESAYYRSKHLSEFTSIGGEVIISLDLINFCMKFPPVFSFPSWPDRIGIDLSRGVAETVICHTKGNKCVKEYPFRKLDVLECAKHIDYILTSEIKVSKDYKHIYADDGGIGAGIIDILEKQYKWNIQRIQNQWPALGDTKRFGNRGAQNWWRVARIIEEKLFDITGLSEETRKQLYNRYYRQTEQAGKIYLESKKEARAHGRPSPDRADAFILSLTGLTVEDFTSEKNRITNPKPKTLNESEKRFNNNEQLIRHYEDDVTYSAYDFSKDKSKGGKRIFGSLRKAINN